MLKLGHRLEHFLSGSCYLGYERVYLPLGNVADTPFHNQGDEVIIMSNWVF